MKTPIPRILAKICLMVISVLLVAGCDNADAERNEEASRAPTDSKERESGESADPETTQTNKASDEDTTAPTWPDDAEIRVGFFEDFVKGYPDSPEELRREERMQGVDLSWPAANDDSDEELAYEVRYQDAEVARIEPGEKRSYSGKHEVGGIFEVVALDAAGNGSKPLTVEHENWKEDVPTGGVATESGALAIVGTEGSLESAKIMGVAGGDAEFEAWVGDDTNIGALPGIEAGEPGGGGKYGLGMQGMAKDADAGGEETKTGESGKKDVVSVELIALCAIITEVENDATVPAGRKTAESIKRFKATNPHQDTQDFLGSLAGHHPNKRYEVFVERARQAEPGFECPPMKSW